MKLQHDIKYFFYNHKVIIVNAKISKSTIQRNYIKTYKDNNKIINDVSYNLFVVYNWFKKYHINKINKFIKYLIKNINTSNLSYDIELNYYYCKSQKDNSLKKYSNNYYELTVFCYDKERKIGYTNKIQTKKLEFYKLKDEIFSYEKILDKKIDSKEGNIDSEKIIIKKYALTQIISVYKKDLLYILSRNNRKKIYNLNNSYDLEFYDKNGNRIKNIVYSFKSKNSVNDIEKRLNTGYVITNIYFLNNIKENKKCIKALCSGYYLEYSKIKNVFSNKIFEFNLCNLIDGIEFVSKEKSYFNKLNCPDILTKIKN